MAPSPVACCLDTACNPSPPRPQDRLTSRQALGRMRVQFERDALKLAEGNRELAEELVGHVCGVFLDTPPSFGAEQPGYWGKTAVCRMRDYLRKDRVRTCQERARRGMAVADAFRSTQRVYNAARVRAERMAEPVQLGRLLQSDVLATECFQLRADAKTRACIRDLSRREKKTIGTILRAAALLLMQERHGAQAAAEYL